MFDSSLRSDGRYDYNYIYEGLSAAFDYQGRVLAAVDYFTSDAAPMVSYVPTKGVRTVYSAIGDVFAWLCAVGFLMLVGWALIAPLKNRHIKEPVFAEN